MQIEPEINPWEDTQEQRGPERDNPLEGAGSGAFGASPETVGVPNVTGQARPKTTNSDRNGPRWSRGALLGVIGVLLVVLGSSAYVWLF